MPGQSRQATFRSPAAPSLPTLAAPYDQAAPPWLDLGGHGWDVAGLDDHGLGPAYLEDAHSDYEADVLGHALVLG